MTSKKKNDSQAFYEVSWTTKLKLFHILTANKVRNMKNKSKLVDVYAMDQYFLFYLIYSQPKFKKN